MQHVAIDLGSRESHICRRDATGEILESRRLMTASLRGYLSRQASSRVILESCSEAFHFADLAQELGHEVRVVPATLVRSLGVGSRGIKTDERDAALLSEASCRIDLPSVHIPSESSRKHRALSTSRERLIDARTMLVNNVRGWLRTRSVVIQGRYSSTFAGKVRSACEATEGAPAHIERTLESIEQLSVQIRAADQDLAALTDGELHQRLMSVPGVGPVTAVRFVAAVDVRERFPNAHALQSYLGLTAGERSSGAKRRRTGITKAGAPALRAALVQAAWVARNSRKHHHDPMVQWALRLKERRNGYIASVALARKLAGILFAIWRDGGRYDPTRGANKSID